MTSTRTPAAGERLVVDDHEVRISHPDKVMYSATGTTKIDVVRYYLAVADRLLPLVAGRPVTRKRWVDGVGTADDPGQVFFEKNLPAGTPDWVERVAVEHRDHTNDYPLAYSPATLAWFAQLGSLELHVPQWRIDTDGAVGEPDRFVLDLDPGPKAGLPECIEVAHLARELLAQEDLDLWPVTSGSKGLHLYADLAPGRDAETVHQWAHEMAEQIASRSGSLALTSMKRSLRTGKVLIDWSQNHWAKTTVSPLSLRGRAEPFVAAPRTWEELADDPRQLRFEEVLERIDHTTRRKHD